MGVTLSLLAVKKPPEKPVDGAKLSLLDLLQLRGNAMEDFLRDVSIAAKLGKDIYKNLGAWLGMFTNCDWTEFMT